MRRSSRTHCAALIGAAILTGCAAMQGQTGSDTAPTTDPHSPPQCSAPIAVMPAYVPVPSSPDSMGAYSAAVATASMDASMETSRAAAAYSACLAGAKP